MTRSMSRGAAVNIPVARPGLHAAPRLRLAISAFAGSIFGITLRALDAFYARGGNGDCIKGTI